MKEFMCFFVRVAPAGFKEALNVMPASPASEVLYENLHVTRLERAFAQVKRGACLRGGAGLQPW